MSKEEVLEAMRAGRVLVGAIGDYGRSFRLEYDGTWDNIPFTIVQELISEGAITAADDRGDGQREYAPVTE